VVKSTQETVRNVWYLDVEKNATYLFERKLQVRVLLKKWRKKDACCIQYGNENTDGWLGRMLRNEVLSYYEKLLKEKWRAEKEETTYVEWCYIISKVSGSTKGSKRWRRMESYKEKRKHSWPLDDTRRASQLISACWVAVGYCLRDWQTVANVLWVVT